MSLSARIAKNTAIQAVGKILGLVLAILAAGIMLRYLKDEGNGFYTTVTAFLQMFGIAIDLGLYIILIKKLSGVSDADSVAGKRPESRIVNVIFTLRVVTAVVVLGLAPLIALFIGQYNDNYSLPVVGAIAATTLFYFFLSMNQLLSAIFQKFLQTQWVAIGELAGKLLQFGLTVLVVALGGSVFWMLMVLVASAGVNFFINVLASRKFMRLRFAWDRHIVHSILKEAWPIALSIICTLIYFKGDTFVMTFFETKQVVGQYGAPYKILEVLVTFPAMFAGLVLPILTQAWNVGDRDRFQQLFQRSFAAISIIAIPILFGVQVLAPQIMTLIAGADFASDAAGMQRVVNSLRILILATTAIYFGTLFGYLVVALNKQKTMLFGYAFVALTAMAGYLIFIPRFSVYGAAWVTVYSETMIVLIGLTIILLTTRIKLSFYAPLAALASAIIMYLVLRAVLPFSSAWHSLPDTLEALITVVMYGFIGALIYGIALLLTRATSLTEIKSLIHKRV
jgi:O-antigen/teichoic acid export membrane protein